MARELSGVGVIGIPARPLAYADFWKSFCTMDRPSGTRIIFTEGSRIDQLRNQTCEMAVDELNADWVLFLDDDHYVPEDLLTRLLAHNLPFVGGLYMTRTEPYRTCSLKESDKVDLYDSLSIAECDSRKLVEIGAIGMGGTLIRREVFDALPRPWFQMHYRKGFLKGEDVFFCELAREHGFKIYSDTDLRLPHITQRGVMLKDGGKVKLVSANSDTW